MKKQLTALFFIVASISSTNHLHATWWWVTPKSTIQQNFVIPDISTELRKEFDRICQRVHQDKITVIEIEFLKQDTIPLILQNVEYRHAQKPFNSKTEALDYAYSLVYSACFNFYIHLVTIQCEQKLKIAPPCSPEFMDPKDILKGVINYLSEKAFSELSKANGNLGQLLQNLDKDIAYAIHLTEFYC